MLCIQRQDFKNKTQYVRKTQNTNTREEYTNHKAAHPELKVDHEEMISSTLYNLQHTVPLCLHD